MSLSMQVLDFYDDVNKDYLREIAEKAPSFIKTAKIAERDELTKLSNDGFALHILTKEGSRLKKYPTHTPADTWLSCAYFEKNAHKLPLAAAKIAAAHLKHASLRHGLEASHGLYKVASGINPTTNLYVEELDSMRKVAAPVLNQEVKQQEAVTHYALGNRYPLHSEEHVKTASAYLSSYVNQFKPQERHEFASNLVKRASELGLDVFDNEVVSKYAGSSYGDLLDVQLRKRASLVDGITKAESDLMKVASQKSNLEAAKFAELLHAWDTEYGVEAQGSIKDAFQSTFGVSFEKTAAAVIWQKGDLSLTDKELKTACDKKADKIKSYFGESLAKALKKDCTVIFESLPSDAKAVIAQIAKGHV